MCFAPRPEGFGWCQILVKWKLLNSGANIWLNKGHVTWNATHCSHSAL